MAEKHLKPGWKIWRFEQMATNVNVRIDNPSESGMEHYVGLEHLDPDSLRIRRWGSPNDVEATKLCFKKGDIIFARRRAYQRKLGVAEFDGICSAHAMVLRAKAEVVLPDFLAFFMQSDLFMNRAVEISVGSLSPTINWKTMAVQKFVLPSMEDQLRIVESVTAVDECLESALSALSAVQTASQSFLTACFPECLEQRNVLTHKGVLRPLSELADVRTGLALGKKNGASQLVEKPYLRVANVQDGALDLSEMKTVHVTSDDMLRFQLMPGDVLMTEGGDFDKLGRGTVWGGQIADCLHQNHVFAVRPDPSLVRPEYLAALGRSPHGKRYFRSCAKRTSNLASINKRQLSAFPIIFVHLEIQEQIVSQISAYDWLAKALKKRLGETQRLRSDLLKSILGIVQ